MHLSKGTLAHLLAGASLAAFTAAASAQQTVKIGVVIPYTGGTAEIGQQVDRGIQMFMKLNPNAFGPYKVELIRRDSKAPDGTNARVAVQELIVQDKVDIVTGMVYSPDVIASAPLVTAAKKPMIIMNAGTAWLTNLSPTITRVASSVWHSGYTMGEAAVKTLKAKTAVVGYTDYPPGKDSVEAFKRGFEAAGGKVIDDIPMGGPAQVPDFTPFLQRAKDKKPDVFYVFVPSGLHSVGVIKTYAAHELRKAGIKLIGPGELVQDLPKLEALGNDPVGIMTMHHYISDIESPGNKHFVEAWKKEFGQNALPDFLSVGGYDGMAAIAHVVTTMKGKIDGSGAVAALKGWKYESPRGPISIDPETRDVVMNVYLSELVRKDGKLYNRNVAVYRNVKDMCKEQKVGRCK